jgi:hypothetical protein
MRTRLRAPRGRVITKTSSLRGNPWIDEKIRPARNCSPGEFVFTICHSVHPS